MSSFVDSALEQWENDFPYVGQIETSIWEELAKLEGRYGAVLVTLDMDGVPARKPQTQFGYMVYLSSEQTGELPWGPFFVTGSSGTKEVGERALQSACDFLRSTLGGTPEPMRVNIRYSDHASILTPK
ncbi:hypothetical protein KW790_01890 [Candidatus Parcubacteria bacterium]|nr:hypothetical protein [Candidatus Parcubacteria bacterium]